MLRGYVFDVDGTLVLSNDAHARAWQEVLADAGHSVHLKKIRKLIGMGGDKLLASLGLDMSEADKQKVQAARLSIFLERYVGSLQPAPGARKLIKHIKDQGLEVVIATSAQAAEVQALLEKASVADLVAQLATADDANNSKPDPGIVQAALQKAGLTPDEALMVGDTPYDIEAAQKAGVRIVALRCGGWSDADLAGAAAIYDNPEDMVAHMSR